MSGKKCKLLRLRAVQAYRNNIKRLGRISFTRHRPSYSILPPPDHRIERRGDERRNPLRRILQMAHQNHQIVGNTRPAPPDVLHQRRKPTIHLRRSRRRHSPDKTGERGHPTTAGDEEGGFPRGPRSFWREMAGEVGQGGEDGRSLHWSEDMVSKDADFLTGFDGEKAKATIFGGVEERP